MSSGRIAIDDATRDVVFGRGFRNVRFLGWIAIIFFSVRLIDFIIFDLIPTRRQSAAVPLLLRQIVTFSLYIFLFVATVSSVFNVNVTAFLVSGTVVAAVLGLALQETLGNLFSGIALNIEQAFGIGDVIKSGDLIGVVEAMNWRATRLRAFNNNVIVLPNSQLSREKLEVFPMKWPNARIVVVEAGYHVAPATVIRVLEKAVANIEHVARDIPCLARVGGFGEYSVHYEVKYWTRSYHLRDGIDAEIRRTIWYAFRRNGIHIPFPIRTLQRMKEHVEEVLLPLQTVSERLRGVDILAPLSESELARLAEGTHVVHYGRGETVIAYGQEGESMYIVHSGSVSVRLPSGDEFAEVAQLGPGSIVGEMALLTGESRTADVVAISDVTALNIQKPVMQSLLDDNPDLAAALSEKIVERRAAAASLTAAASEEGRTLLGRIRSYFGLTR